MPDGISPAAGTAITAFILAIVVEIAKKVYTNYKVNP
jgi:hypothetical protein